jgi:DNA-binding transcriptional regulator YhcF (GntR family)
MRPQPGLTAALAYLEGQIDAARNARRARLPPIKSMARSAGVAHGVMSRGIAELRQRGILEARPRSGITIRNPADASAHVPQSEVGRLRWQGVTARIRTDIMDGLFGHALLLPAQKELAARYDVSPITMHKVLHGLVQEGMLVSSGRKLRHAAPSVRAGADRIVLFVRGLKTGELAVYTPRLPVQFNALEQVCVARNVQLQVVTCYMRSGSHLSLCGSANGSLAGLFDPEHVHGFMIWQMGLYPEFTRSLADRLQGFKKPTTLFCEEQKDLNLPGVPGTGMVRYYAASPDFEAGVTVGRHLTSLGHRRICCWSDQADLAWARDRVAGIERSFADAGLAGGVEHISAFAEGEFGEALNEVRITDDLRQTIRRASRRWGVVPREAPLIDAAGAMFFDVVYREHVYRRLEPAMRRVLRDRDVTAWVGINDSLAAHCLDNLNARGTGVPGEIAVMGFDDGFDAAARRITSYNFNGAAAMNRMVDFILRPDTHITRSGAPKPVVTQGFVHERATTARVRS